MIKRFWSEYWKFFLFNETHSFTRVISVILLTWFERESIIFLMQHWFYLDLCSLIKCSIDANYKLYLEILPLEEHGKSKAALENHSAKRIAERNGRIGGLPKHNSHEPLVAALAIRRKKEQRFKHKKWW